MVFWPSLKTYLPMYPYILPHGQATLIPIGPFPAAQGGVTNALDVGTNILTFQGRFAFLLPQTKSRDHENIYATRLREVIICLSSNILKVVTSWLGQCIKIKHHILVSQMDLLEEIMVIKGSINMDLHLPLNYTRHYSSMELFTNILVLQPSKFLSYTWHLDVVVVSHKERLSHPLFAHIPRKWAIWETHEVCNNADGVIVIGEKGFKLHNNM